MERSNEELIKNNVNESNKEEHNHSGRRINFGSREGVSD